MSSSDDSRPPDRREEILTLCRAVRQATEHLHLDPGSEIDLAGHLSDAEAAANSGGENLDSVKAIRYVLLESADGPLVPFLADAAAQIIGDGFGKLFYKA